MSEKWTPVRRGEIYCSPACGGNCTQAAFELANIQAERLCEQLNNMAGGFKDWQPYVWENLGWHYQVRRDVSRPGEAINGINECIIRKRHSEDPEKYRCSITINGRIFYNHADTPEKALLITMTEIRQFMQAFENSFARFQAIP